MNLHHRHSNHRKAKHNANQRRASALIFLLVSIFTTALLPTIGAASVSIMPLESKLQVTRPGARLTDDIEVYNSNDAAIHVSTSVSDWTMNLAGQKQFHDAGTQPLSCAQWIQINPTEFSLAPGKSMRVRFSVTPPETMTQEHWAMIFFTARAVPKMGDNGFALNVQTRMGCKILVSPNSKAPLQGQIAGMSLQNSEANLSKVGITFVNPSAVSVRLNGTVEARNANGEVVAKGKITPEKALVLVGAKRELWAQFDKALPPGTYQIKAAIDYGGKELVGGVLKSEVPALEILVPATPNPEIPAVEIPQESPPALPPATPKSGAGGQ